MNHPKNKKNLARQNFPTARKVFQLGLRPTRQKPYGNETKEDSPNLKITFLKSAENFPESIGGEL